MDFVRAGWRSGGSKRLVPPASLIPLVAVVITFAACDPCRRGESICEDNKVRACVGGGDGDGPVRWEDRPSCGDKICKVIKDQDYALCVAAVEPDPGCPPLSPVSTAPVLRCSGSDLIECQRGYRTALFESCRTGAHCEVSLMLPGEPRCALSAEPDPLCAARPELPFYIPGGCDGSVQVTCNNGYRIGETECGAGLCYTSPAHGQVSSRSLTFGCVASNEPDPRCSDETLVSRTDTDGHVVVGCDEQGNHFRCLDGRIQVVTACSNGCDRARGGCRLPPV
jgi:hypothetical protein